MVPQIFFIHLNIYTGLLPFGSPGKIVRERKFIFLFVDWVNQWIKFVTNVYGWAKTTTFFYKEIFISQRNLFFSLSLSPAYTLSFFRPNSFCSFPHSLFPVWVFIYLYFILYAVLFAISLVNYKGESYPIKQILFLQKLAKCLTIQSNKYENKKGRKRERALQTKEKWAHKSNL